MTHHPPAETEPQRVLRLLSEAARPYGVRVVRERGVLLPDLMFVRPGDGVDVMGFRYCEPEGHDPYAQLIVRGYIDREEELRVEAHLTRHVIPVIQRHMTLATWGLLETLVSPGDPDTEWTP